MADETVSAPQAPAPAENQTPATAPPALPNNPALNALQGMSGGSALANALGEMRQQQEQNTPPANEPPPNEAPPVVEETPAAPPVPENQEAPPAGENTPPANDAPPPAEEPEKVTITSPIFGEKPVELGDKAPESQTPAPQIENLEQVNSYLKENLGIEDFSSLNTEVMRLREVEKTTEGTSKQLEGMEGLFKTMPPELYQAIDSFSKGKEWREDLVSRPALDFQKEVSDYKDQELLNAYGKSFTKEQWEEYNDADGDQNVKLAINTALDSVKNQFGSDKAGIALRTQKTIDDAAKTTTAVNQSLEASVANFAGRIEGVSDQYIQDIKKGMLDTLIRDLFFEADGTYKPDAVERAVMAKDGMGLMTQYQTIATRAAESSERQEILSRGADTPPAAGGGSSASAEEVRPEVLKHIDIITGGLNKRNTY